MAITRVSKARRVSDGVVDLIVEAMADSGQRVGAPEVFLGGDDKIPGKHLYVVWEGWGNLDWEQRAEAVFSAYKQFRPDDARNLTLAMGLTKAEWLRLELRPDVPGE